MLVGKTNKKKRGTKFCACINRAAGGYVRDKMKTR